MTGQILVGNAGGENEAFESPGQRRPIAQRNRAKKFGDVAAELTSGGVLERFPLRCSVYENETSVNGALFPCKHLARLQAINRFCDGGRFQIHPPCQFTDGYAVSVFRQKIQRHKLRGAETCFLKMVEIRSLDQLPDRKPRGQESFDLFIVNRALHRVILLEERGSRGTFVRVVEKMERETGFEPATSSLGSWHSTTELLPRSQRRDQRAKNTEQQLNSNRGHCIKDRQRIGRVNFRL